MKRGRRKRKRSSNFALQRPFGHCIHHANRIGATSDSRLPQPRHTQTNRSKCASSEAQNLPMSAVANLPSYPLPFQDWSCFLALPEASCIARVAEFFHAGFLHLNAISRLGRRLVVAILDYGGMVEVLMQMVNEFQYGLFARYHDIIDCAQVLGIFWKTHAS